MDRFTYFDHTSEMKFQAYGKSMDEAFANAAAAMTDYVTPVGKVRAKKHKKVHITGTRKESLLYDFLDEVLFHMDTTHFLTASASVKVTMKKDGGGNDVFELIAALSGDDADEYPLKGDIKAITYNDMQITEEKGKWTVQVVCDI